MNLATIATETHNFEAASMLISENPNAGYEHRLGTYTDGSTPVDVNGDNLEEIIKDMLEWQEGFTVESITNKHGDVTVLIAGNVQTDYEGDGIFTDRVEIEIFAWEK